MCRCTSVAGRSPWPMMQWPFGAICIWRTLLALMAKQKPRKTTRSCLESIILAHFGISLFKCLSLCLYLRSWSCTIFRRMSFRVIFAPPLSQHSYGFPNSTIGIPWNTQMLPCCGQSRHPAKGQVLPCCPKTWGMPIKPVLAAIETGRQHVSLCQKKMIQDGSFDLQETLWNGLNRLWGLVLSQYSELFFCVFFLKSMCYTDKSQAVGSLHVPLTHQICVRR